MAREDKGSGTSSTQDAPSGKSGDPESSSLAARRARLRGTMAKQIIPPEPYSPPPYEAQLDENGTEVNAAGVQVNAVGIAVAPANPDSATASTSAAAAASATTATALAPSAEESSGGVEQEAEPKKSQPDARSRISRSSDKPSGSNGANGSKSFFDSPDGAALVDAVGDVTASLLAGASSEGDSWSVSSSVTSSVSSSIPSGALPALKTSSKGASSPFANLIETRQDEPEAKSSKGREDKKDGSDLSIADSALAEAPLPPSSPAAASAHSTESSESHSSAKGADAIPANNIQVAPAFDAVTQSQMLEMLSNIDQQLGICSLNMAHLSKAATEQLDVVRSLADIIQQQAFNEISLSLNSLSESMSAALEPMQAVGELVPAIDALVVTLGSRPSEPAKDKEDDAKLTPEQLVMSLADQLSVGKIDAWTFKCSYMAVFPSEHPADLLRRLVDLLGSQRLSGDFFRAAYDAVQMPDPPPRVYTQPNLEGREVEIRMVQDEAVLAQIEELRQQNEQMRMRMDAREEDFAELLASKDQEVQETQQMLNSRWEEFSSQYEKLSELVNQRNEMIQEKDRELSQKETEIGVLKAQLDEMKDHTREMVADLQRQLTSTKAVVEEHARNQPKPSTSFFDQPQQPSQTNAALFDSPKPLFAGEQQTQHQQQQQLIQQPVQQAAAPVQQPMQQPVAQVQQPIQPAQSVMNNSQNPVVQPSANPVSANEYSSASATSDNVPVPAPMPTNQAIPRPQVAAPTTPFASAAGSYGSGVRAQVFEVIVRQALAGAPWREICAGPMQVNNISADEVEAEVKRRQALLKK
jgi:hypothetical protein